MTHLTDEEIMEIAIKSHCGAYVNTHIDRTNFLEAATNIVSVHESKQQNTLAKIQLLVERIDEDRKAKDWQSMHINISELISLVKQHKGEVK